jgi:hypothetical protein
MESFCTANSIYNLILEVLWALDICNNEKHGVMAVELYPNERCISLSCFVNDRFK